MIRRAFLLSLALVALLAAPVAAQTGYGTPAGTAVAGADFIRVTGEGCPPNGGIGYSYSGPESGQGTATAGATGAFSFTISDLDRGTYNIAVQCGGQTFVLSATVGAAGAAPAPVAAPGAAAGTGTGTGGTALPRTGSDSSIGMAQLGFAALAVGSAALFASKRRKAKAWAA
jgi:LPXTG-motif cell wall-anchored protein